MDKSSTEQEIMINGLPYSREPYADYKKVAAFTGFHIVTLQGYVKSRKIPCYKVGKRVFFKLSEIDEWMQSHKRPYKKQ